MLNPKSLDLIKQQLQTESPKTRIISIEVGNGFAYGHVIISSPVDKDFIYSLAVQLEWTYKEGGTTNKNQMYRTSQEFKDGKNAIAVGEVIRDDLISKGWQVDYQVKPYR